MDAPSRTSGTLALLASLFRERRSGVLTLGTGESAPRVLLRHGQVTGLGPIEMSGPLPRPDDSAAMRLDRVLQEIGIRKAAPRVSAPPVPVSASGLRDRVLEALVDPGRPAAFEEGAPAPPDVAEVAGATEPLILEAVRRLGPDDAAALLGDLDGRLVATAALVEERTLTLTEGYILSRIDGLSTAREVMMLVPLDPEETQRTLLGLLLTGRVECRPAPVTRERPEAAGEHLPTEADGAPAEAHVDPPAEAPAEADIPEGEDAFTAFPTVEAEPPEAEPVAPASAAPPPPALDPETFARRREILEAFTSLPLKNHFEVLGVEPGCTDAEVRQARAALVRRFHPDAHRDDRLADLHDMLTAIFIRVEEALEVLGDAKSRASYEARLGVVRRTPETRTGPARASASAPAQPAPAPAPPAAEAYGYVPPEETLLKAQLLLAQARYWDAIQVLETAIPHMEPGRHQIRGRILLARAYAKNPNWVRKAEEQLQDVVRDDPANVDAHYELGMLYKSGGLPARAQAMFRRALELRPDHREAATELDREGPGPGGLLKRLFGRGKAS
jgi:tetratricopeptide (TPR) repeat protein